MFFTPVIRRTAYHPALRSLDRNFERFFNDAAFNPAAQVGVKGYQVNQTEIGYTLSLDVPGVAKEQLSIGIEGTIVRVESPADAPRVVKAAYELPQDLDAASSTAKLENGVLTLTLAKKTPVSNVTSISIN